ncbi:MAG: type II toxin-antitoxin system VapC family toxin [Thermoleophilaceae bacterium]|nr:type II toxin-antitoxin system VapC family toxin [Thermoleophilaceae bacterium]
MDRLSAVLDAWALIAFLRDEPAADRVRQAMEAGAAASWVNLGEVLYVEARRQGERRAEEAVEALAVFLDARPAERDAARRAGLVKARGGLSYADCFAVATAEELELPLLTGDPEIVGLQRAGLQIEDLRR